MGKTPFQAAIDAARELVGPIIAMTITLATVYTPVALQGGLTGTLFHEFAFTLAGAVLISGIVALTLSPMMGSKLLRAGDTERGFAGMINRRFDAVRELYTRILTGTLRFRPVVLTLWALVLLLIVPFYMFSQKELAPPRGSEFRLRHHPGAGERHDRADESLRQEDGRHLSLLPGDRLGVPDHLPDGRIRRHGREAGQSAHEIRGAAADGRVAGGVEDPRHSFHRARSSVAARQPGIPRRSGHRLHRGAGAARGVRESAGAEGVHQRQVHVRRHRPEVRPAAGQGGV